MQACVAPDDGDADDGGDGASYTYPLKKREDCCHCLAASAAMAIAMAAATAML